MSNFRKRSGVLALAASMLAGVVLPLTAGSAAAAGDPLAGSTGPTPLFPHMSADQNTVALPPAVDKDTFERHPVLSWQPITSLPVTRYRVELSPNADWTNNQVALPNGGLTNSTQYELPMTLPHASYFWRVRGEDAAGDHTAWSGAQDDTSQWQFTRTWVDRPKTLGSTQPDGSVQLTWAPLTDASTYELQISNDPLFPPNPKDPLTTFTCFTNHTTWSLERSSGDGPMEGDCGDYDKLLKSMYASSGPWYWHVRGIDRTTSKVIATETSGPCLATGADCSGWSTPVDSFSLPDISATVAGQASNLGVPGCTAVVSGGSGIPLCEDTPTMTWDAVPGADGYIVDVSADPMFTVLYRSYGVWFAHSLTPRDSYLDNTSGRSYYWRVIPCDYEPIAKTFDHCQSTREAAPVSQFHKHSWALPYKPASTTASVLGHNGLYVTVDNNETFADRTAQVRTGYVTFHWDDYLASLTQAGKATDQDAMQYVLEYATNPYFDNATEIVVDGTRWTPQNTLADGGYYWRVQPVDGSDNPLTWSAYSTFVKGTVRPVASVAGSSNLNPFQKVEIDFSVPVRGITSSTLGIADAVRGTHVAGAIGSVTSGSAFFTPTHPLTPGQHLKVWVSSAVKDLAGNPAVASATIRRVNPTLDSSSSLVSEQWDVDYNANAMGHHYAQSSSAGDKLTFRFAGSTMRLYGTRMRDGGYADVYVDGSRKGAANFYASSTRWKQVVFSTILSSGSHTAIVVVRGRHQSGSQGSFVYVDALRTASGTMQESGAGVSQRWSSHRATDAYHGSYDAEAGYVAARDNNAKPSLTTHLDGQTISVYACKSPDSGLVSLYVDGVYKGQADLYQSYSACNKRVMRVTVSTGRHLVLLVPTGTHRSASTGTKVSIDRLTVN